ncbi:MAG: hypothetical protein ACM3RX_06225 [Methanococcaceae archaeon]
MSALFLCSYVFFMAIGIFHSHTELIPLSAKVTIGPQSQTAVRAAVKDPYADSSLLCMVDQLLLSLSNSFYSSSDIKLTVPVFNSSLPQSVRSDTPTIQFAVNSLRAPPGKNII